MGCIVCLLEVFSLSVYEAQPEGSASEQTERSTNTSRGVRRIRLARAQESGSQVVLPVFALENWHKRMRPTFANATQSLTSQPDPTHMLALVYLLGNLISHEKS